MESKKRKYLEILKVELEDLVLDLEFGEEVLAKRLKEHEITEYVFHENLNLLKREILGIEHLKKKLADPGVQLFSLAELHEKIENYFQEQIKDAGLPDVVFLLVSRKLEKVHRYMQMEEEP